ncbi:sugar phosphate isomerase/epimerase family protein [Microbacterium sp. ASV49]|uniref:Sugar phosphate isomerase/epimerase n=1 Tax=Microbacterium candidum TaxID=3041922 RepID=A0ABT7N235_9MICO|nr:sugar phosphate isomerase/epimerase [Microbacterium sp. ASV49]MDL9980752.1 sugar phosphate isomerase/epimerase [Microbacterium sp. ASV49]
MIVAVDIGPVIDRPLGDALALAAETGYTAVELGNRDDVIPAFGPLVASPGELADARRVAAATAEIAAVAVIQDWAATDEDVRRNAVEWWIDGIHAAARLGVSRLNSELVGSPQAPIECRAAFLRSIEQILPVLEREDMELSIEPHPGDFIETTTGALELFEEIGSGRIRYLHCFAHFGYLGGTTAEQIHAAAGRFDHIHLADTFRPERSIVNPRGLDYRVHQHFDIGAGEIDWTEAAGALRIAGFDGLASVQVFGWNERVHESFRRNRSVVAGMFPGLG